MKFATSYYGITQMQMFMDHEKAKSNLDYDRDQLTKIRDYGFNNVEIVVPLIIDHLDDRERQALTYSEDLIRICKEVQLNIICMFMSQNARMFKKYPDLYQITSSGAKAERGWIGYCINHREFLKDLSQSIRNTVNHFKNYDSIVAWEIINEPMYFSTPGWVDYNTHTIVAFREWLKKKYGKISRLHEKWQLTNSKSEYSSFNSINPPKDNLNKASWYDWNSFRRDNMSEFVRWWIKQIESVDTTRPILAKGVHQVLHPYMAYCAADYYKYAAYQKLAFGLDIYVETRYQNGLTLDMARTAAENKPIWIGEFNEEERHFKDMNDEKTRKWSWQIIARNCRCLGYWQWKWHDESFGKYFRGVLSLLKAGDKPSETLLSAQEVMMDARRLGEMLTDARYVDPDVAIYYSWPTFTQYYDDFSLYKNFWEMRGAVTALEELRGVYMALMDSQIPLDILTDDMILDGKLEKYKALILPGTMAIGDNVLDEVEEFAKTKGRILADVGVASMNEYGVRRQPHPVKSFGCVVCNTPFPGEVGYLQPLEFKIVDKDPSVPLLDIGAKMRAGYLNEAVDVEDGKVLGTFVNSDLPAIIRSGNSVYVTTDIFLAYRITQDEKIRRFVEGFVKWAGVERIAGYMDATGKINPDVEVDLLRGTKGTIFILINHSDSPVIGYLIINKNVLKGSLVNSKTTKELSTQTESPLTTSYSLKLAPGSVSLLTSS